MTKIQNIQTSKYLYEETTKEVEENTHQCLQFKKIVQEKNQNYIYEKYSTYLGKRFQSGQNQSVFK